ncbi:MAG: exo-alpha-sialidase [Clostridia bacterium]|nr:exo-alpha-sialidase [Clostridia bacterium]
MFTLWDPEKHFPAPDKIPLLSGTEYRRVHTAVEGEYQFLLGAAVIRHEGILRACWGNSFRGENDDNTILFEKCSADGGMTWDEGRRISRTDAGFGRSHGVYAALGGELYAFCPRARYERIDAYPELVCEGYRLHPEGNWEFLGTVLPDRFWPMCEPIRLENGNLLMAGLETDRAEAAVALCREDDVTRWEMKRFENPEGFRYWGETTVLRRSDRLTAIIRGGNRILCSESTDEGESWSSLEQSNFPISASKMYAGTLQNGLNYLIFNAETAVYREALCIAIGDSYFRRVFLLRRGFDAPPRFWGQNEWCYPYAWEDREAGLLYVIYAKNKEDCELAILPTTQLTL